MFTSNQIEEIRKKLQLGGAKDTQFPLAELLRGNEVLVIVQEGINKQLTLKSFLDSVSTWSLSDFLNISKSSEDSYTLEEVLNLVIPINRKAGQVITFKDKETGDWAIYQFKGERAEEWFNLDFWDNILAKSANHFKGLITTDDLLNEYYTKPLVGNFAFVGETLEKAKVYRCSEYGVWEETEELATSFINEDLKDIVDNIFNNLDSYPELIEIIKNNTGGTGSSFSISVVSSLPNTGVTGVIYLIKDNESTGTNNVYKEYIWINNSSKYEELGSFSTKVELSDYVKLSTFNSFVSKFIFNGTGTKFLSDSGTYKTITKATQTSDGLMSKEDKEKLDGLAGAYIQIVTQETYSNMFTAGLLDENTVYHIKG